MRRDAAVHALHTRFLAHVQQSGILRAGSDVVVAFSGGLDSCVLLHLLRFHLPELRVSAAHFDHTMRTGSEADADWVRGLCTAWSVPLHTGRASTPPAAEAEARNLRYAFLQSAAVQQGAASIATAHHADDQAETVLFRLARGTGVPGLAGIPERRGIIVRPLLPFRRAELLDYATRAGLHWREDPTNVDLRFDRNRIRHAVLPALDAVRPGAVRRIAKTAARVAEAEAAWKEVVEHAIARVLVRRDEDGFALARDRLLDYHPHIRARVIRRLVASLGARPDRAGTDAALQFISTGASGGWIELAGGNVLEREFDLLLLRRPPSREAASGMPLRIAGVQAGAGSFVAGDRTYRVQWAPALTDARPGQTATFDPSSLRFPLELRAWRAGDRIRLAYGSKKLKKLFQERRVGRARRRAVAVLSDATGGVLWVVGLARSVIALPSNEDAVFQITVVDGDTE